MKVEARDLALGYGPMSVVRKLNLELAPGRVVTLLGPNGAGKTTTVLGMAGAIRPLSGAVLADGTTLPSSLHGRAKKGFAYVGEDRSVFMQMTVTENLRVARADSRLVFELFPELAKLAGRRTGLLSGGEQQMLSLGRALGRRPKVLLVDELSLGLAPLVVDRLLQAVREAADRDELSALVVEQHVDKALAIADHVYVLRRGEVVMEGEADEMRSRRAELAEAYLSGGDRN